jgi:hypothetical protein
VVVCRKSRNGHCAAYVVAVVFSGYEKPIRRWGIITSVACGNNRIEPQKAQ